MLMTRNLFTTKNIAYNRVVSVSANQELNTTIGGAMNSMPEPMDIGALQHCDDWGNYEPYIDYELLEGMYSEHIDYLNAMAAGARDISKMACFYCSITGHLTADCFKRKAYITNGT